MHACSRLDRPALNDIAFNRTVPYHVFHTDFSCVHITDRVIFCEYILGGFSKVESKGNVPKQSFFSSIFKMVDFKLLNKFCSLSIKKKGK